MKRILFVAIMLFCVMTVSAQQYDVTKLVGKWNVVSQTGAISSTFDSFKSVTFGDARYVNENGRVYMFSQGLYSNPVCIRINNDGEIYTHEYEYAEIFAFIISGGNKLNVIVNDNFNECQLAMIIKKMTSDELVLANYSGTCELVLRKGEVSKVASLSTDSVSNPEYYTISGYRVSSPDKGVFVEKTGKEAHLISK